MTAAIDTRAADLNRWLEGADAPQVLRHVLAEAFPGRIAVSSSFGIESAVLLDLVAQVDPATPVLFLDTGMLFAETLIHARRLQTHLGLTDVRWVRPDARVITAADPKSTLWRDSTDACCALRKVLPLEDALEGFDAWITGRKRFHGGARAALPLVEADGGRLKVNPLAGWSAEAMERHMADRDLPRHPLEAEGYRSVGCAVCTRRTAPGEDARAGRWAGTDKTECGIHRAPWFSNGPC